MTIGVGALGNPGTWNTATGGGLTGFLSLLDMTDGTSNTIMLAESAGGQQVYGLGTPVGGSGWTPGQAPAAGFRLNCGWADYNNFIEVTGFDGTGTIYQGGCSCVNVTNGNPQNGNAAFWTALNPAGNQSHGQIYSFHTGGGNVVRGDGSVTFMAASISPTVLAAVITRAGGEVYDSTQF